MKLGSDYEPNHYKLSDRLWLLLEALTSFYYVELGSCVFKLAPKYDKIGQHTLRLYHCSLQQPEWLVKVLECEWASAL